MKEIFLTAYFFIISLTAINATECVDRIFEEEHLIIYLCQNHSNYNETTTLLFQARAQILNDYIGKKIKLGELQNKKIQIQLYDPILSYPQLNISQGRRGYFVSFNGFPSFQKLKIFVDYFASKNWKPFFTSNINKASSEIERFFHDNKTSEIIEKQINVWELDNLRLQYINDKLKYFINSTQLNIKATSSLPVKIKDRFLLFQTDSIFILEGQAIIKLFKIDKPIDEDYDIYLYDKWVNICNGGEENWIFSYSYDKNKFYKKSRRID